MEILATIMSVISGVLIAAGGFVTAWFKNKQNKLENSLALCKRVEEAIVIAEKTNLRGEEKLELATQYVENFGFSRISDKIQKVIEYKLTLPQKGETTNGK